MAEKFVVPIHGSDHCPGGPDPIPCLTSNLPWARISFPFAAAAQSIANNSITNVEMVDDYNMAAGEGGENYFDRTTNFNVRIKQAGWYSVTAQVFWAVAVTWNYSMLIGGSVAGWMPSAPGYFDASGATVNQGVMSYVHAYPANWQLILGIYQRSGSAKNLDSAYLEVVRLGDFSGTMFTSQDPNS